ncbi:MAG: YkgJ family cysteine cluster protein [Desulfovibrionaceae bacterium]|nr:YkgJ family cysteine cluster protein [Desulfovibrionaceae bacterium]
MIPDLTPIFVRYEKLRAETDNLFTRIREEYPACVTCKEGCSDCCHALFDLSLVEGMYINRAFEASVPHGPLRSAILTRASETDRRLTRLKRDLYRAEKDGEDPLKVMTRAAQLRLRCPLLDEDDRCLLYDARPITCRLYGVPTAIAGQGHVCGFSAFEKGHGYPTVHLDKIQARLEALSLELAQAVGSRFSELHETYVPLSMALITRYDEDWLGIGPAKAER